MFRSSACRRTAKLIPQLLLLCKGLDVGLNFVDVPIFFERCRNSTLAVWIMNLPTVCSVKTKIKTYIILDRVLMRLGVGNCFSCIIIFVEHLMGLLSVDSSW
jgi:hypothetical protein